MTNTSPDRQLYETQLRQNARLSDQIDAAANLAAEHKAELEALRDRDEALANYTRTQTDLMRALNDRMSRLEKRVIQTLDDDDQQEAAQQSHNDGMKALGFERSLTALAARMGRVAK
jgi:hypothetical protein